MAAKFRQANATLGQLERELKAIPAFEGPEAIVQGLRMKAEAALGTNDPVRTYEAQTVMKAIQLIRAAGEVGNLSRTEQDAAAALLPKVTDPKGTRELKIKNIKSMLALWEAAWSQTAEGDILSFSTIPVEKDGQVTDVSIFDLEQALNEGYEIFLQ